MNSQKYTLLIFNSIVLGITNLSWTVCATYIEWTLKILVLIATLYVTIYKHLMAKKRNRQINRQHEDANPEIESGY